jgi:SH3 and multiple ankyrin repeat domains protein
MIRTSSNVVSLTVITMPINENLLNNNPPMMMLMNGNNARQCSTLPRRMSGPNKMPAPAPPRRDPKTTLSVGRARARSMVAGLEGGDMDDDDMLPKASSIESIHQQTQSALSTPTQGGPGTPIQPRTASIKCRPTSSRITAAELEDLFQRQQGIDAKNNRYSSMMTTSRFQSNGDNSLTPQTSPSKAPIVYASMADMKRKKAKNGTVKGRPVAIPSVQSELKRSFHSSPDLANVAMNGSATWTVGMLVKKGHLSQDDMHNIHSSIQRLNLPPPNHPPPPIPDAITNHQHQVNQIGQVVKVNILFFMKSFLKRLKIFFSLSHTLRSTSVSLSMSQH